MFNGTARGVGRRLALLGVLVLVASLTPGGTGSAGGTGAATPRPEDSSADGRKVDARLAAKLASLGASETLAVSIWLDVADPPVSRSSGFIGSAAAAEEAVRTRLEQVQEYMAPRRQGVVDALSRMGVTPSVPVYAPAVFARLNNGQIEQLARRSDVATIYGPEQYGPFADDAGTTERVWPVWSSGNLGRGRSGNLGTTEIRPVVHEGDGVSDGNPYLNNATHGVFFWCPSVSSSCPSGKNIHDHPTIVAGEIAATHPLYRGIAPSVNAILSANFGSYSGSDFDTRAVNAFEWARTNGGDPFNMSWGTFCGGFQTFFSRYVDWAVRNLFATVVIAAGNHPSGCSSSTSDEKVAAPGVAWSAITVGNHEDDDSGFWSGDGMHSSSDWRNPDFATGMEKPEVAAVGTNIASTDAQGGDHLGFGWTGTSMSAPQVAGQVALMLARRPGQNQWPETNKAAVLVSAYHDIEGGLTDRSRDGVGAVVAKVSDDTYRLGRFVNDCDSACEPLEPSDFPRNYPVPLTAGTVVRIAIAWDSWSTGGSGSDTLGADINLRVFDPGGTLVASSLSAQNAWEMVEFTVPASGTYNVRASLASSESGWPGTFLGMAYSVRSLPNFCTTALTVPPGPPFSNVAGGTSAIDTANGTTFFDSYSGWGFGQSGRERVLKLNLTSTKDLLVSDTNATLDLHVLQFPNCAANPIVPTVLASGSDLALVNDAPPGTYYVVVDGRSGAVGTTTATVSVMGP